MSFREPATRDGEPGPAGAGAATPRGGGRRQERYQRRRREVIDAATRLFSEKGYEATSLLDIADAVGLLKGSLYYYARSKEDLLFAIIEDVHAEGLATAEATRAADGPPEATLRTFVERGVAYMATHRAEAQIYFHDRKALSPERQELLRPQRREFDQTLRDLLAHGQRTGAFRTGFDPAVASAAIVGAMNWVAIAGPGLVPDDAAARERFVHEYADTVVHSVLAADA